MHGSLEKKDCGRLEKKDGGREGIRTLDLSVANAALSQLSYAPIVR
jgi:hypothetical protein